MIKLVLSFHHNLQDCSNHSISTLKCKIIHLKNIHNKVSSIKFFYNCKVWILALLVKVFVFKFMGQKETFWDFQFESGVIRSLFRFLLWNRVQNCLSLLSKQVIKCLFLKIRNVGLLFLRLNLFEVSLSELKTSYLSLFSTASHN